MDNYPYSVAALSIRRELEPSMLNGDAHHSLSWEVELRIGRCRFSKTRSPQSITEAAPVCSPVSEGSTEAAQVLITRLLDERTHPLSRVVLTS